MRNGRLRVQDLAREAHIDLDDALIRLWEAGLDDVLDPTDCIVRSAIPAARAALDLESPGDLRSIAKWALRLNISEDALRKQLVEMGVRVTPAMRNLPKGSVAKVRSLLRNDALRPAPIRPSVAASSVSVSQKAFEWRPIGRCRNNMSYLTPDEVTEIHSYLVDLFALSGDPIEPPGVKYPDLLSSALGRPQTSLGDSFKYPTAEMAAAALLHSLTLNHPFHNGNKRTALVSMLVFLDRNDVALTADESEILKLVLRVARRSLVSSDATQRNDREVQEVARWIHNNQRVFTHGDRSVQFRVIRRILRGFDCDFHFPANGNRVNITRVVEQRAFLNRSKNRELETQVYYRNEGTDVARSTINKIRHDLQLDEEHGCDSSAFYNSDIETIDEIVAQYQTTLKRLAKL
jgi:death-on-curing family protein